MTTKILFNSLGPAIAEQRDGINDAIKAVIDRGVFVGGFEVKTFERAIANIIGCDYAISCANGTDALILTLLALSLESDQNKKDVITVANSAPATVAAIRKAGLNPVFVDVLPNGLMNLEKACLLFSLNTLALMPVHLYGQVVDLTNIVGMCQDAGIYIVEDAAQAYGSFQLEKNKSTAKCLSFYPTKNLGALGDGGMVLTNSVYLANNIHVLKNYGMDKNRNIYMPGGFNSRLDELQAAILITKMENFKNCQQMRHNLAKMYFALLPDELLHREYQADENYHLFTIRTKHRAALKKFLEENGVETAIHYPRPAHRYFIEKTEWSLPETEALCNEVLSLPLWPGMKIEQVVTVANLISDFVPTKC